LLWKKCQPIKCWQGITVFCQEVEVWYYEGRRGIIRGRNQANHTLVRNVCMQIEIMAVQGKGELPDQKQQ